MIENLGTVGNPDHPTEYAPSKTLGALQDARSDGAPAQEVMDCSLFMKIINVE